MEKNIFEEKRKDITAYESTQLVRHYFEDDLWKTRWPMYVLIEMFLNDKWGSNAERNITDLANFCEWFYPRYIPYWGSQIKFPLNIVNILRRFMSLTIGFGYNSKLEECEILLNAPKRDEDVIKKKEEEEEEEEEVESKRREKEFEEMKRKLTDNLADGTDTLNLFVVTTAEPAPHTMTMIIDKRFSPDGFYDIFFINSGYESENNRLKYYHDFFKISSKYSGICFIHNVSRESIIQMLHNFSHLKETIPMRFKESLMYDERLEEYMKRYKYWNETRIELEEDSRNEYREKKGKETKSSIKKKEEEDVDEDNYVADDLSYRDSENYPQVYDEPDDVDFYQPLTDVDEDFESLEDEIDDVIDIRIRKELVHYDMNDMSIETLYCELGDMAQTVGSDNIEFIDIKQQTVGSCSFTSVMNAIRILGIINHERYFEYIRTRNKLDSLLTEENDKIFSKLFDRKEKFATFDKLSKKVESLLQDEKKRVDYIKLKNMLVQKYYEEWVPITKGMEESQEKQSQYEELRLQEEKIRDEIYELRDGFKALFNEYYNNIFSVCKKYGDSVWKELRRSLRDCLVYSLCVQMAWPTATKRDPDQLPLFFEDEWVEFRNREGEYFYTLSMISGRRYFNKVLMLYPKQPISSLPDSSSISDPRLYYVSQTSADFIRDHLSMILTPNFATNMLRTLSSIPTTHTPRQLLLVKGTRQVVPTTDDFELFSPKVNAKLLEILKTDMMEYSHKMNAKFVSIIHQDLVSEWVKLHDFVFKVFMISTRAIINDEFTDNEPYSALSTLIEHILHTISTMTYKPRLYVGLQEMGIMLALLSYTCLSQSGYLESISGLSSEKSGNPNFLISLLYHVWLRRVLNTYVTFDWLKQARELIMKKAVYTDFVFNLWGILITHTVKEDKPYEDYVNQCLKCICYATELIQGDKIPKTAFSNFPVINKTSEKTAPARNQDFMRLLTPLEKDEIVEYKMNISSLEHVPIYHLTRREEYRTFKKDPSAFKKETIKVEEVNDRADNILKLPKDFRRKYISDYTPQDTVRSEKRNSASARSYDYISQITHILESDMSFRYQQFSWINDFSKLVSQEHLCNLFMYKLPKNDPEIWQPQRLGLHRQAGGGYYYRSENDLISATNRPISDDFGEDITKLIAKYLDEYVLRDAPTAEKCLSVLPCDVFIKLMMVHRSVYHYWINTFDKRKDVFEVILKIIRQLKEFVPQTEEFAPLYIFLLYLEKIALAENPDTIDLMKIVEYEDVGMFQRTKEYMDIVMVDLYKYLETLATEKPELASVFSSKLDKSSDDVDKIAKDIIKMSYAYKLLPKMVNIIDCNKTLCDFKNEFSGDRLVIKGKNLDQKFVVVEWIDTNINKKYRLSLMYVGEQDSLPMYYDGGGWRICLGDFANALISEVTIDLSSLKTDPDIKMNLKHIQCLQKLQMDEFFENRKAYITYPLETFVRTNEFHQNPFYETHINRLMSILHTDMNDIVYVRSKINRHLIAIIIIEADTPIIIYYDNERWLIRTIVFDEIREFEFVLEDKEKTFEYWLQLKYIVHTPTAILVRDIGNQKLAILNISMDTHEVPYRNRNEFTMFNRRAMGLLMMITKRYEIPSERRTVQIYIVYFHYTGMFLESPRSTIDAQNRRISVKHCTDDNFRTLMGIPPTLINKKTPTTMLSIWRKSVNILGAPLGNKISSTVETLISEKLYKSDALRFIGKIKEQSLLQQMSIQRKSTATESKFEYRGCGTFDKQLVGQLLRHLSDLSVYFKQTATSLLMQKDLMAYTLGFFNRKGYGWPTLADMLLSIADEDDNFTGIEMVLTYCYSLLFVKIIDETIGRLKNVLSSYTSSGEIRLDEFLIAIELIDPDIVLMMMDSSKSRFISIILCEISTGFLIRKEQMRFLEQILSSWENSEHGLATNIIMGGGKTSFLTSTLIMHHAITTYEGHFNNPKEIIQNFAKNVSETFIVLPQNLTEQSHRILYSSLQIFGSSSVQLVLGFLFNSPGGFTELYYRKQGEPQQPHDYQLGWLAMRVLIVSDKELQRMFLKEVVATKVRRSEKEEEGRKYSSLQVFMKQILRNTKKTLAIFDEIDFEVNPITCQMNIAMKKMNRQEFAKALDFVARVASGEDVGDKSVINPWLYEQIKARQILSKKNMLFLHNYGFGRDLRNAGEINLSQTKEFTLEDDPKQETKTMMVWSNHATAIPYESSHNPMDGSKYSDVELWIVLTMECYLQSIAPDSKDESIQFRPSDFEELVMEIMLTSIRSDVDIKSLIDLLKPFITPAQTDSILATITNWRGMSALYLTAEMENVPPILQTLFNKFKNDLQKLTFDQRRCLAKNFGEWVCRKYIQPAINQATVGMLEFMSPALYGRRVMFSGTSAFAAWGEKQHLQNASSSGSKIEDMTEIYHMSKQIPEVQNPLSIEFVSRDLVAYNQISTVLSGFVCPQKPIIGCMPKSPERLIKSHDGMNEEDDLLRYFIDGLLAYKRYQALIDCAGVLRRSTSIEYAKRIANEMILNVQRNPSTATTAIQVFFVDDGVRKFYTFSFKEKQTSSLTLLNYYNEIPDVESTLFAYLYCQRDTIGIDFRQPGRLHGLLTIRTDSMWSDVAQAAYRLRKLGYGHTFDYCTADPDFFTPEWLNKQGIHKLDDIDWSVFFNKVEFDIQKMRTPSWNYLSMAAQIRDACPATADNNCFIRYLWRETVPSTENNRSQKRQEILNQNADLFLSSIKLIIPLYGEDTVKNVISILSAYDISNELSGGDAKFNGININTHVDVESEVETETESERERKKEREKRIEHTLDIWRNNVQVPYVSIQELLGLKKYQPDDSRRKKFSFFTYETNTLNTLLNLPEDIQWTRGAIFNIFKEIFMSTVDIIYTKHMLKYYILIKWDAKTTKLINLPSPNFYTTVLTAEEVYGFIHGYKNDSNSSSYKYIVLDSKLRIIHGQSNEWEKFGGYLPDKYIFYALRLLPKNQERLGDIKQDFDKLERETFRWWRTNIYEGELNVHQFNLGLLYDIYKNTLYTQQFIKEDFLLYCMSPAPPPPQIEMELSKQGILTSLPEPPPPLPSLKRLLLETEKEEEGKEPKKQKMEELSASSSSSSSSSSSLPPSLLSSSSSSSSSSLSVGCCRRIINKKRNNFSTCCEVCDKDAVFYCNGCNIACYCSEKCQQKAWKNEHYIECKNISMREHVPCPIHFTDAQIRYVFSTGGFFTMAGYPRWPRGVSPWTGYSTINHLH